MATYRQVHTSFWQDGFVLGLTPEEKYFYLYLMTNSKTTQCGVYELPKRIIEMETGYNRETVDKLLNRFIDYGKVRYHDQTQEIFISNWLKYNGIKSPKVIACIQKELKTVKNPIFIREFQEVSIRYGYGIDSLCIDLGEEEEKEEEKEEEQEREEEINEVVPYSEIIKYLNEKAGTKYRPTTEATKKHIRARWNQKYQLDDFMNVIDKKCAEWLGTDMEKYLSPDTLFGTKFEKYLNQKTVINGGKNGKVSSFERIQQLAREEQEREASGNY